MLFLRDMFYNNNDVGRMNRPFDMFMQLINLNIYP